MKVDVKDYRIVKHTSPVGLRSQVMQLLGLGWQLQGGVSVDPNSHEYLQAMIEIREDFLENRT